MPVPLETPLIWIVPFAAVMLELVMTGAFVVTSVATFEVKFVVEFVVVMLSADVEI